MSNFALRSDWYDSRSIGSMFEILEEGDLLEYHRGSYSHWAICLKVSGKHSTVIHRVGSEDVAWCALNNMAASVKLSTSRLAKGDIGKEPLLDVLGQDLVRINNSRDKNQPPRNVDDILSEAAQAIGCDSYGDYDLVSNNCEHFAKQCRYGEARSDQVRTTVASAGAFGVVVAVVGLATWLFSGAQKQDEEQVEKNKQKKLKC